MLGALSSRSALSVLVGALFKKFGLFLNKPRIFEVSSKSFDESYVFVKTKIKIVSVLY
jgi:hypothetical protein